MFLEKKPRDREQTRAWSRDPHVHHHILYKHLWQMIVAAGSADYSLKRRELPAYLMKAG